MKQIGSLLTTTVGLLLAPVMAFAQFDEGGDARGYLASILEFINGTAIIFLLGLGFLFFVWGMFQYFIVGGANDEAKEKGKSLIIYATAGFVMILILWGVVGLVANMTGLDGQVINPPQGASLDS